MFSTTAKNIMLNALTPNLIKLHSGDPGVNGTANLLTGASAASSHATATVGTRELTETVDVPVEAGANVAWASIWQGTTHLGNDEASQVESYTGAGTHQVTSAILRILDPV